MAPNLAEAQHVVIRDIDNSKQFKAIEIADVAGCSPRAIYRIKKNLRCYSRLQTRLPLHTYLEIFFLPVEQEL